MNETSHTLDTSTFFQLQEEERHRLANALMQGPGQVLANVLMEIEYSIPLLKEKPDVALAGLNALRGELRTGLLQLQDYVAELQPPLLVEMGLGPSTAQYVKKFGERTGIRVECHDCERFTDRYPATIETALFRILQEALTNVETHAQATRVRVQLTRDSHQVRMTIQDNGRGLDLQGNSLQHSRYGARTNGALEANPTTRPIAAAHVIPARPKRQLGLIAMRDRAQLLGGQMQVFSRHGDGVRVLVTIPYHGHPETPASTGGLEDYERTNTQAQRSTLRRGGRKTRSEKSTARRQRKTQRS